MSSTYSFMRLIFYMVFREQKMSHRNKCVVILFSVLIVFFFYAYFNNRYYEKSATIYQIDFLQQLSGIENLSSLTFHREQKLLYATQNRPATLLKLNLKGELLHSVPVPFLSDAETIEHICGNIFAAIDESTSELFFFSVSDDMTITLRNSIPLQKFNKKIKVLKELPGIVVRSFCMRPRRGNLTLYLPGSCHRICLARRQYNCRSFLTRSMWMISPHWITAMGNCWFFLMNLVYYLKLSIQERPTSKS